MASASPAPSSMVRKKEIANKKPKSLRAQDMKIHICSVHLAEKNEFTLATTTVGAKGKGYEKISVCDEHREVASMVPDDLWNDFAYHVNHAAREIHGAKVRALA
jgi:hypothetical protein